MYIYKFVSKLRFKNSHIKKKEMFLPYMYTIYNSLALYGIPESHCVLYMDIQLYRLIISSHCLCCRAHPTRMPSRRRMSWSVWPSLTVNDHQMLLHKLMFCILYHACIVYECVYHWIFVLRIYWPSINFHEVWLWQQCIIIIIMIIHFL